MINEVREQIRKPIASDYLKSPKDERRQLVATNDFAIAFQQLDRNLLESLEKNGFKFLGTDIIFAAISIICEKCNLQMPHPEYASGKSINQLTSSERKIIINDQKKMTDEIFKKLVISFENGKIKIKLKNDDETTEDITQETYELATQNNKTIVDLQQFQGLMNRVLGLIKKISSQVDGLGIIVSSPSQADISGPVIGVNGMDEVPFSWRKDADKIITGKQDKESILRSVLKELVRYQQLVIRRKKLAEYVANGEIELETQFEVENWPRHPLMDFIKKQAIPIILDQTKKSGILCDEQDIRYQTIFRLTTIPFSQLFHDGQKLVERLRQAKVYEDWRNILSLDSSIFSDFKLQEDVVREVVNEQLVIIKNRLDNSPLPVKDILTKTGIFAEKGWVMEKDSGNVFAVRYDDNNKEIGRKKVRFELVAPEIATAFHHAFHYIHTPRTGTAYGLFLENDTIPFSVLAVEPIDRSYKENMLLMHGYDPKHCIDLARLYSRPGTPFNASSTMFSLVFADIKANQPEIQAVLSAFMPTYATGKSMLSGGFDNAVLVKPNRHYFGKKSIGNQEVWEHLTKRRRSESTEFKELHSDMPMLPVVELMTRLKPPRLKPLPEIDGKMVVCNQ